MCRKSSVKDLCSSPNLWERASVKKAFFKAALALSLVPEQLGLDAAVKKHTQTIKV